jgi:hypothetical protein
VFPLAPDHSASPNVGLGASPYDFSHASPSGGPSVSPSAFSDAPSDVPRVDTSWTPSGSPIDVLLITPSDSPQCVH